jgi:hypothetical protein
MRMVPVASSALSAVGYDPERQVLRVEFRSRAMHEYEGVGPAKYQAVLGAPSLGRHFRKHILGQHTQRKVVS